MRKVDQWTSFDRSRLRRAGTITPHAIATMTLVARDIYPYGHVADFFYLNAVTSWDSKAGTDPAVRDIILDGVACLDQDSMNKLGSKYLQIGWEPDRVELLQGVEHTKFFRFVHDDLVVSICKQSSIWPKFSYDGSSPSYGSFLNGGFNDIEWLPSV